MGRTEATTLQSAAALALAEVFRTFHATGTTPLTLTAPDGRHLSLSSLSCVPIFTPVYSAREDTWAGVAYVGATQVFFETQTAQLPMRGVLNAQDHLQVCALVAPTTPTLRGP